jgi:hypothetical protein
MTVLIVQGLIRKEDQRDLAVDLAFDLEVNMWRRMSPRAVGYGPGLIVLNRYLPSLSVRSKAYPWKSGSSDN